MKTTEQKNIRNNKITKCEKEQTGTWVASHLFSRQTSRTGRDMPRRDEG